MFNTVAYNTEAFAACGAAVPLQASIIVGNNNGAVTSASGCPILDIVTDPVMPAFVDSVTAATYDFHLAVDTMPHITTNTNCCIDKIGSPLDGGTSPLPDHDYDGTMRPKGTT